MHDSSKPSSETWPWLYLFLLILGGTTIVCVGLWLNAEDKAIVAKEAQSRETRLGIRPEGSPYHLGALIALSVGGSILATGLCSIVYQAIIRHTRNEKKRLREMHDAGLLSVHKRRELTSRYRELIDQCQSNIDVLGWSLRRFHDSYSAKILSLAESNASLKVRLLVVDPASKEAELRGEAEGESPTYFRDCLETLKGFAASYPTCVRIKVLKQGVRIPTMFFRIDDAAFVGPYFHGQRSNLDVTYEITSRGWLFDRYLEQFETLWRDFSAKA